MRHLDQVNETYFEHMKIAWGTAWTLFTASLVLIAHGVCPWWFTAYGSDTIRAQYKSMSSRLGTRVSEAVDALIECTSVDPEWLDEIEYKAHKKSERRN